jgi:hypothetical protein
MTVEAMEDALCRIPILTVEAPPRLLALVKRCGHKVGA